MLTLVYIVYPTIEPVQELVEYPIAVMEMVEPDIKSGAVEVATHMVDNAPEGPTKLLRIPPPEKGDPTLQTPNGICEIAVNVPGHIFPCKTNDNNNK